MTHRERHFLEAALEGAEAALDLLSDNEAVRAVPVIGTAVKFLRGVDDLRSRILEAKLAGFVTNANIQTDSARRKIHQKIAESPDEARTVGEVLFLVLDRLIDLDKPPILARVYVAYLDNVITSVELKRIAQAIDIAFGDDLLAFLQPEAPISFDQHQLWMPLLVASGLVSGAVGRAPPGLARTRYKITPVGEALRKAWAHAPEP